VTSLEGESVLQDTIMVSPWYRRYLLLTRKLAQLFPETPYRAGIIGGKVNALQRQLHGFALPFEKLNVVLSLLSYHQIHCRKISPLACVLPHVASASPILWLIQAPHTVYACLINSTGVLLSRSLSQNTSSIDEDIQRIRRAAMGRLNAGEVLIVKRADTEGGLAQLSGTEEIDAVMALHLPTMRRKSAINCSPSHLKQQQYWFRWNRLAWRGAMMMACLCLGLCASLVPNYWKKSQYLLQLESQAANRTLPLLSPTTQTLLAIADYHPNRPQYRTDLLRISKVLVDYPNWYLTSIEWQASPHTIILSGKWLSSDNASQRLERAFMRQLNLHQVQIQEMTDSQIAFVLNVNAPEEA
jgi:hypothetical protein